MPKRRREAISERVRELVRDMGGKEKAATLLGVSVRSIEGWAQKNGTSSPDVTAIMQFAEEAHVAPQWLLYGTGPKHFQSKLSGPPTLVDELRAELRGRLIARGLDTWYIDRYLPDGTSLLDQLVDTALSQMEERRQRQRRQLAEAIHEALEEGAAQGWGPAMAGAFAQAYAAVKRGDMPQGQIEVHPLFLRALALEDGAALGRTGTHHQIRQMRTGRARRTK